MTAELGVSPAWEGSKQRGVIRITVAVGIIPARATARIVQRILLALYAEGGTVANLRARNREADGVARSHGGSDIGMGRYELCSNP